MLHNDDFYQSKYGPLCICSGIYSPSLRNRIRVGSLQCPCLSAFKGSGVAVYRTTDRVLFDLRKSTGDLELGNLRFFLDTRLEMIHYGILAPKRTKLA